MRYSPRGEKINGFVLQQALKSIEHYLDRLSYHQYSLSIFGTVCRSSGTSAARPGPLPLSHRANHLIGMRFWPYRNI